MNITLEDVSNYVNERLDLLDLEMRTDINGNRFICLILENQILGKISIKELREEYD